MTPRMLPLLAIATLITLPHNAAAQVVNSNNVGPQTFHKRIEIPNAVGTQTKFNNEDTFSGSTFDRQKVLKQRSLKNRQNRHRKEAARDSRTQSQTVDTNRRAAAKNSSTRHQNQRSQPTANANSGMND